MRWASVLLLMNLGPALLAGEPALPALNVDLAQTTVSGISSGAFMAVQFGVAHSASVRGVAATAGGPYFCAGKDAWAGAGVSKAIARCMQGDPAYPAQPISEQDMTQMLTAARNWSSKGMIDNLENLQQQRLWLFHGYNDGVVKKPVSDALATWYRNFLPAAQVFYKDELKAAHAQISASCGSAEASCQPCAVTGGDFINRCANPDAPAQAYDAAGAALQMFYGPLRRTPTAALRGTLQTFDQRPFAQRGNTAVLPLKIAMDKRGYLYVPDACQRGESCRLHIAFHGCQQQAERVGTAFVTKAGFNEWADANHIVVLYPQTVSTVAVPLTPFNPQGCWDWWGYNDFSFDITGRFATKEGSQISTVWRMAEQIGKGAKAAAINPATTAAPELRLLDLSATQVALGWLPVKGASAYRVYRDEFLVGQLAAVPYPAWSDSGLDAATSYRYSVRSIDPNGVEEPASSVLLIHTNKAAPACDPYFSLAKGRVVTRDNQVTDAVCP